MLVIWVVNLALLVFAAVVAFKMTRLARVPAVYVAWVFIWVSIFVMASRSVIEIVNYFEPSFGFNSHEPYTIGSVVVSTCLAAGIFINRMMYESLGKADQRQREYEKMLLNTTIMTEENERRRFATELHDGLGPLLSSIKMSFSVVSADIADAEIRANLETAINEAIATVREVSNSMSPHILTNLGLRRAIENFVGKIVFPPDLLLSYNITIGDRRYPATHEIVLYRVFCELLSNTLRHANATAINFRLDEEGGNLRMVYKDNGTGFDPSLVEGAGGRSDGSASGMGLHNIVSRITSIKGRCTFRSGGEARAVEGDTERPLPEHGMVAEIEIPASDK